MYIAKSSNLIIYNILRCCRCDGSDATVLGSSPTCGTYCEAKTKNKNLQNIFSELRNSRRFCPALEQNRGSLWHSRWEPGERYEDEGGRNRAH